MGRALRVFLVAGEPSGDRLGAALMRGLPPGTAFDGVGGLAMTAEGLRSRVDISELAVMGIAEVLPRLPLLLRRIREVSEAVIETRPDVLVTIDSPDFGLRVAKRVKAALPDLPVVHYVAPSVWAWRPGRAAKMARHVDHVLALLPFEPPYMEAAGMSCDFVGHPAVSVPRPSVEEIAGFRAAHGIGDAPLLLLAPGSRRGEVRRLLPVFRETVERLRAASPDLRIAVPLAETVAEAVRAGLPEDAIPVGPGDDAAKRLAMAAADAALCASGTVVLELAAANTPMVAAYRTSWLTAAIVRRLLRIGSANLVNLVTDAAVVPEFYQEACTPEALSAALSGLLTPEGGAAQRAGFERAMSALGRDGPPPGQRAADSVLRFLGRRGLSLPAG